jgi:hypothetical protein
MQRNTPTLEPLYHFDLPTGRAQVDQLYANDKLRDARRQQAAQEVPSNGHQTVRSENQRSAWRSAL